MTRRLPLTWNPAWFHCGASLWCLAAKIAYVATARVGAVLGLLTGATTRSRVLTWAASPRTLAQVCKQLELPASVAGTLALRADPTDLEQRQRINLGLRWCPDCLASWYHTAKFQDRRIRLCPWHRVRLRETCPHCARAVDPFGRPWRCGHCGKPLVADPEHWLSGFKTKPEHDGVWPTNLPVATLAYEEHEHGVLCRPDPDGELSLKAHGRYLDYWQQAQLYESVSALWDSILNDHRDCALKEPYGYYPHYYNLDFSCPVAAAGRAVFGQMALDGAMRGEWVHEAVSQTAYVTFPARETVSLEVRRALLRELPRAWLADSLMLFGEAARLGRTSARWEPHPAAFQGRTLVQPWLNGAELVTKRPASWLAATAAFSAENCPNRKALPGSWDPLKLLLA